MVRTPARRFTLSDLMVLVAATALGLIPIRYFLNQGWTWTPGPSPLDLYLNRFLADAGSLLAAWLLATLALALRPPRRSLRQLARQPGFVAVAVSVLAAGLEGIQCAGKIKVGPSITNGHVLNLACSHPIYTGMMVTGAWLPMAIAGRWRPGPSWTDRLGWAIGVAYLALYWGSMLHQLYRFFVVM